MSKVDNPKPVEPLLFGWQEWVSLPDLGLAAIRAKIDTGARTSALHAFDIDLGADGLVTFKVNPIPRKPDVAVKCTARLLESRMITSSNGERERRIVIVTHIEIGGRRWPIEITLTNRAEMRSRMLLGRQALAGGVRIDPTRILCQPRLSYRVYRVKKKRIKARATAS